MAIYATPKTVLSLAVWGMAIAVHAEELSLTTYYPSGVVTVLEEGSPFETVPTVTGLYDQLVSNILFVRGGTGDFDGDGMIFGNEITRANNCNGASQEEPPRDPNRAANCAIGDLNGDGRVNGADIYQMRLVLGTGGIAHDQHRASARRAEQVMISPVVSGTRTLVNPADGSTVPNWPSGYLDVFSDLFVAGNLSNGAAGLPVAARFSVGGNFVDPIVWPDPDFPPECPFGTIFQDLNTSSGPPDAGECREMFMVVEPTGEVGVGFADAMTSLDVLGDVVFHRPQGTTDNIRFVWYGDSVKSNGVGNVKVGEDDGVGAWDAAPLAGSHATFAAGFRARAIGTLSGNIGGEKAFAFGNSVTAGLMSLALGDHSVAGNTTSGGGSECYALGSNINADYAGTWRMGSLALGNRITTYGPLAMAVGSGVSNANPLTNSTRFSLAVGFNSTVPTLFIPQSRGRGTTGNVGVGTSAPTPHPTGTTGILDAQDAFLRRTGQWASVNVAGSGAFRCQDSSIIPAGGSGLAQCRSQWPDSDCVYVRYSAGTTVTTQTCDESVGTSVRRARCCQTN